MNQIPYMQIRGGSSKGVYFLADDLPKEIEARNKVILGVMEGVGLGDKRQIDGLGGGTSLSAKVAIVSKSQKGDADLDYLFLQVVLGEGRLSDAQNCGNILAGVLPFAIETGIFKISSSITSATIKMVNSDSLCKVILQTPNGKIQQKGTAKVDGVLGTAAPISCNYINTEGINTGALFPTGNVIDIIDGIKVSCVDNGMPVVHIKATDVGVSGYESKEELDKNLALKETLEGIRLKVGPLMNLGDAYKKTVPKMCLLSASKTGKLINTRTFIPHTCHAAVGVMAAFSTAACCITKDTVASDLVTTDFDLDNLEIEHPSGSFFISLETELNNNTLKIVKSGAIRTARIISKGVAYIPE